MEICCSPKAVDDDKYHMRCGTSSTICDAERQINKLVLLFIDLPCRILDICCSVVYSIYVVAISSLS